MGEIRELVVYMAKALVDIPEQVDAKEVAGEQTAVIELKVADTDRGKVIGKEGRIIKAMRTIVNAASAKLNKRATVEIIE